MGKPLPKAQPPSARNRLRAARPLQALTAPHPDRTIDNEEIRGGCRGGRASFSWDTVKQDKHRNMYLGNSLKANVWRSARPSDWYLERAIDGGDVREDEERDRVKREEQLVAKITARFGFGALSELEKYKAIVLKEMEEEECRKSSSLRVTKPVSLVEELRREKSNLYK